MNIGLMVSKACRAVSYPWGFVHSEDWHLAKDDMWFIHTND